MKLVDVDALILELNNKFSQTKYEDDFVETLRLEGISESISVVQNHPAIKPRQGRWEDIRFDYLPKTFCSACGHIAYFDCDDERYVKFDYCPYCGADMIGGIKYE